MRDISQANGIEFVSCVFSFFTEKYSQSSIDVCVCIYVQLAVYVCECVCVCVCVYGVCTILCEFFRKTLKKLFTIPPHIIMWIKR